MKFVITIRWLVGVGWVAHIRGKEYRNLSMRQVSRLRRWALTHGAKRVMKYGARDVNVEIFYNYGTARQARAEAK